MSEMATLKPAANSKSVPDRPHFSIQFKTILQMSFCSCMMRIINFIVDITVK